MPQSRVQEYITIAMFELLEKKDYAHITVQDLVDRAGVCRASFYRNYFTRDEVIERFLDGIFTEAYPREHVFCQCGGMYPALLQDSSEIPPTITGIASARVIGSSKHGFLSANTRADPAFTSAEQQISAIFLFRSFCSHAVCLGGK